MKQPALAQEINNAIGAHGMWKLRLRTAISMGSSDVDPRTACRDDQCPFGKWIHGPTIDTATRAGMPYQVVRRLHREFHESAGKVLSLALSSRAAEADALYNGEFIPRSEKLVRALTKWKGEVS
ncbi:hypothetical protein GCM10007897_36950 [Sphingobium jiangsuense]|uniref:Chemoreceptor zinc-binding domain-containing protein n=1 Tax=Sphingobium jiangsuense TaxID=870476 RepID=A0A7W6BM34_9SPHN|nr:CZB domain-containing protein [Sphingobium jiangsuense]MBB3927632.1 hypothetical protein [Sphingobium jiangsuense]GLT02289.1 hypothetical protein GCM10007897_36950 [Sphingobium jiangsuense]